MPATVEVINTLPVVTSDGKNSVAVVQDNETAVVEIDRGVNITYNGDRHYTQSFVSASGLTVTHNLGKYPAVTVHDSTDEEVEVEVDHTNQNECVLSWPGTFSGRVTCN